MVLKVILCIYGLGVLLFMIADEEIRQALVIALLWPLLVLREVWFGIGRK